MTRRLVPDSMPKKQAIPRRASARVGPYERRPSTTTNMATIMNRPMQSWPAPHTNHHLGWDASMQYPQQPMLTNGYMEMQPVRPPPPIQAPAMHNDSLIRPGTSGPWTAEEDSILVDERSRGLAWDDIHNRHFPTKSGNACRKRHERLMVKARESDWDDTRISNLLNVYHSQRETIWAPLAKTLGERWEDVEKVLFQQGLRSLRAGQRVRHSRTQSRTSSNAAAVNEFERGSSHSEYDNTDDSGIGLGPGGHSRRSSELTTMVPPSSLPGVDHILAHQHMTGSYGSETQGVNGYGGVTHPNSQLRDWV
ncbi:hypothetical protein PV10_03285 [Exophiala mesophila]|uniref:Myb-like domain-containing protein n=1 Tax=Exophiala mesophila TaxID=212818 RepID=A0A0D1X1L7_EXOME|nr:uncharacterized protein PV10_03285 [Exophiala mesophila]KIV95660.1 hypothetical protein PV10_03285 [Exophiala mesophila]